MSIFQQIRWRNGIAGTQVRDDSRRRVSTKWSFQRRLKRSPFPYISSPPSFLISANLAPNENCERAEYCMHFNCRPVRYLSPVESIPIFTHATLCWRGISCRSGVCACVCPSQVRVISKRMDGWNWFLAVFYRPILN